MYLPHSHAYSTSVIPDTGRYCLAAKLLTHYQTPKRKICLVAARNADDLQLLGTWNETMTDKNVEQRAASDSSLAEAT